MIPQTEDWRRMMLCGASKRTPSTLGIAFVAAGGREVLICMSEVSNANVSNSRLSGHQHDITNGKFLP